MANFHSRTTWGFEYRSPLTFGDWPFLHVCFKYNGRRPQPAKGVIAIGQFAIGFITISQFGIGFFSLCQFALAAYAVAQFGVAYSLAAQMGFYIHSGVGMFVIRLSDWIR